ncbi:monooxygenase family protein [Actinophytocola sp.]|uniref:monooxygenase family protein n=1 Tax=Actinophytocola sp. TaxID=1872138 RepID=UPI0038998212
MPTRVNRHTVDLSAYPDLIVLYLGMRVNLYGIRTFFSFGRKISASVADEPDGLLLHEPVYYSFFPMNMGMRQYWQDLPSLLDFARSQPHRQWWLDFLADSDGNGFWHETYSVKGGMEAVYDDVPKPLRRGPARSRTHVRFGGPPGTLLRQQAGPERDGPPRVP